MIKITFSRLRVSGTPNVESKVVRIFGEISDVTAPTPCRIIQPDGLGRIWLQTGPRSLRERVEVNWIGLKQVEVICWNDIETTKRREYLVK